MVSNLYTSYFELVADDKNSKRFFKSVKIYLTLIVELIHVSNLVQVVRSIDKFFQNYENLLTDYR